MKLKNSHKILTYLLVFSLALSSCKKEDTTPIVKDSEEPEISFQAMEENTKLRGAVEINLNVSDNSEVSKVEVYVNNTLVTTLTEAPYKFTLNTEDYPDGTATIKAIAYDKEGNKKEVAVNITISNTLLTVIIPQDAQIDYDNEVALPRWMFISDMEGKSFALKKYENGQTLNFNIPVDFVGDQIYLNKVSITKDYHSGGSTTRAFINNFLINVGEVVRIPPSTNNNNGPQQVVGNTQFSINNVPFVDTQWNSDLSFEGYKGRISASSFSNNTMNVEAELFASPVNGLYSLSEEGGGAPKYKFYENLEDAQFYEEDYNNLATMTGLFQYEFPAEGDFNYSFLRGRRKAGDRTTSINLGFNMDKLSQIFYPENLFEEIETTVYYSGPQHYYSYYKIGSSIGSFDPFEVSKNVTNSSIDNYSVTSNGVYDSYSLLFFNSTQQLDDNFQVYFYVRGMNTSTITGTLPIIPYEIMEAYPSISRDRLVLSSITFNDYLGINSEEYFNTYVRNTANNREERSYSSVTYRHMQPNGRKASSKGIQQKEFEESLKEARGY